MKYLSHKDFNFSKELSIAVDFILTKKQMSEELDVCPRVLDRWINGRNEPCARRQELIVSRLKQIRAQDVKDTVNKIEILSF